MYPDFEPIDATAAEAMLRGSAWRFLRVQHMGCKHDPYPVLKVWQCKDGSRLIEWCRSEGAAPEYKIRNK